jgi:hypothetical protein
MQFQSQLSEVVRMKNIEILDKAQNYYEKIIQVEGFLVYINKLAYIAPGMESIDKISESILITEPTFIQKLRLSDAPPCGGGRNSYPYNIVAEGRIVKPDDSLF